MSDDALLTGAKVLAARARGATAELIAHLAEIDARRLYVTAGHPSLFVYCREALLLSEHATYHRIDAARTARRFPILLELLARGTVNLTTINVLGRHLTAENHVRILESARGLGRARLEEMVARLAPVPDVPVTVRKLPAPAFPVARVSPPETASDRLPADAAPLCFGEAPVVPAPAVPAPAVPTAAVPTAGAVPRAPAGTARAVSALSPDRYKLQLTISGETLEKLRLAKDLLRHSDPSGDEATILDRALTVLLIDLVKKKFAATERPRTKSPVRQAEPNTETPEGVSESRYIPAEVKRTVFVRDPGRCAFIGTDGRRCGERAFVEFHHVHPYAEGGHATVENIQLRCRLHNAYEWWQRTTGVRLKEDEWYRRPRSASGGQYTSTGVATGRITRSGASSAWDGGSPAGRRPSSS